MCCMKRCVTVGLEAKCFKTHYNFLTLLVLCLQLLNLLFQLANNFKVSLGCLNHKTRIRQTNKIPNPQMALKQKELWVLLNLFLLILRFWYFLIQQNIKLY